MNNIIDLTEVRFRFTTINVHNMSLMSYHLCHFVLQSDTPSPAIRQVKRTKHAASSSTGACSGRIVSALFDSSKRYPHRKRGKAGAILVNDKPEPEIEEIPTEVKGRKKRRVKQQPISIHSKICQNNDPLKTSTQTQEIGEDVSQVYSTVEHVDGISQSNGLSATERPVMAMSPPPGWMRLGEWEPLSSALPQQHHHACSEEAMKALLHTKHPGHRLWEEEEHTMHHDSGSIAEYDHTTAFLNIPLEWSTWSTLYATEPLHGTHFHCGTATSIHVMLRPYAVRTLPEHAREEHGADQSSSRVHLPCLRLYQRLLHPVTLPASSPTWCRVDSLPHLNVLAGTHICHTHITTPPVAWHIYKHAFMQSNINTALRTLSLSLITCWHDIQPRPASTSACSWWCVRTKDPVCGSPCSPSGHWRTPASCLPPSTPLLPTKAAVTYVKNCWVFGTVFMGYPLCPMSRHHWATRKRRETWEDRPWCPIPCGTLMPTMWTRLVYRLLF